jgi:hypothetical protein
MNAPLPAAALAVPAELLLPEDRVVDLSGYLETALMLARELRKREGFAIDLCLRLDSDSATALLITTALPPLVAAALERRHMRYQVIDFHDDSERTVVTWQLEFLHHTFAIVSQTQAIQVTA